MWGWPTVGPLTFLTFCTCRIFVHAIKMPSQKCFQCNFISVVLVHLTLWVLSWLSDSPVGFYKNSSSSGSLSIVIDLHSRERTVFPTIEPQNVRSAYNQNNVVILVLAVQTSTWKLPSSLWHFDKSSNIEHFCSAVCSVHLTDIWVIFA